MKIAVFGVTGMAGSATVTEALDRGHEVIAASRNPTPAEPENKRLSPQRVNVGTVHVNLATISPDLAEEAASLHSDRGIGSVAAPVFGGVPVAEAGNLNIVVAGADEFVARVRPSLEMVSAKVWPVGSTPRQAALADMQRHRHTERGAQ